MADDTILAGGLTRDGAVASLRRLQPALNARGIAHAAIFGSVSRDAAGPRSDLDVFVTPASGVVMNLIALGAVQSLLEATFPSSRIDLVVAPVRNSQLADAIEATRVDAF